MRDSIAVAVDGKIAQIKVVRNSRICRIVSDKIWWLFGSTVYVAGPWLTQKIVREVTVEIQRRPKWKKLIFRS